MLFHRLVLAAICLFHLSAGADVVTIATKPQGSLAYSTGAALSKVMVQKTDLQFRIAPYGGGSTYLPFINRGEEDFGFANGGEISFARDGAEYFTGGANENLRLVGVLYEINGTFAVPTESAVRTVSDLRGRKLPSDYSSGIVFKYLTTALLATAGLSFDDVERFPVSNFVAGVNAMIEGKVDAAYIPLNSGIGKKAMARMSGGWRYITFDATPDAREALGQVLPFSTSNVLQPADKLVGVTQQSAMISVQYYLVAGAHVDDEVAYQVTKTIYSSKDELAKAFGVFNRLVPETMPRVHSAPYHPGAIRWYEEQGLWPPRAE